MRLFALPYPTLPLDSLRVLQQKSLLSFVSGKRLAMVMLCGLVLSFLVILIFQNSKLILDLSN